jgi:uncharacterized protein YpmS
MLTSQTKATAFSLLSPTDYKLIRKAETGEAVDEATTTKRAAIRAAATANEETIPDEADYKAVLSDNSIVYFDQATANNRTTFTEITA